MTANGLTPTQFEQVLKFFFERDLPKNFKIKHDEKIKGKHSEVLRQIDVLAVGQLGVTEVIIAGEAKNWKKKVDVEVIDALNGKYGRKEDVPADKVLIFSNAGFTKSAIEKGKKLGYTLLQANDPGEILKTMPIILGIAHLKSATFKFFESSKQGCRIPMDHDQMILLSGKDKIPFQDNLHDQIHKKLASIKKDHRDLPKELEIEQHHILYEIEGQDGYRWNCNLRIKAEIGWFYQLQKAPYIDCVHVNTGRKVCVPTEDFSETIKKSILGNKEVLSQKEFDELMKKKPEAYAMTYGYTIFDSENSKVELIPI